LESQSFIVANSLTAPAWDFTSVWTTNGGTQTPQLTGFVGSAPPTGPSGNPVVETPTDSFLAALEAFEAEEANQQGLFTDLNFSPPGVGNGLVSVDNPDGGDGSVNDGSGSGKKGTNIASGSSTSGVPALSRLLTAGSGINSIFHGGVSAVQPPPFVFQKFELILNNDSESELSHAVFGAH
jgi:hypothetical protein